MVFPALAAYWPAVGMNNKTDQQLRVWALARAASGRQQPGARAGRGARLPFEEKRLALQSAAAVPAGAARRDPEERGRRCAARSSKASRRTSPSRPGIAAFRSCARSGSVRAARCGRCISAIRGISPDHFDLVVPTPEYPVPDAPNVMRIPFALEPAPCPRRRPGGSRSAGRLSVAAAAVLLVGGPTLYWELPATRVARRSAAARRSRGIGGRLGHCRRQPEDPAGRARRNREPARRRSLRPICSSPAEGPPAYPALIEAADRIYVTADSVAMIADAVTSGKPVGVMPIAKSRLGQAVMAVTDVLRPGQRLFPRDLRFFWAALTGRGLRRHTRRSRARASRPIMPR